MHNLARKRNVKWKRQTCKGCVRKEAKMITKLGGYTAEHTDMEQPLDNGRQRVCTLYWRMSMVYQKDLTCGLTESPDCKLCGSTANLEYVLSSYNMAPAGE